MWASQGLGNFWRVIWLGWGLFLFLFLVPTCPTSAQRLPLPLAGRGSGGVAGGGQYWRNWAPPGAPIFQLQQGRYDYGRGPLGYRNYWGDGYLASAYLDYSWMRSQHASQPLAFVLRWKDGAPGFKTVLSFGGTAKLKEGMKEDEVAEVVGVPLQRWHEGEREIWKYSAFRLVFEGGRLKGYQ